MGQIYCPDGTNQLMLSYARIPVIDHLKDSVYSVYFGSRDNTNRERIFRLALDLDTLQVLNIENKPILDFGENLGAFDDNGITPCSIICLGNLKYFYYCGWNIHVKVPFSCAIGLAVSDDDGISFKKLFKGAIMDRNHLDHIFVAVNDVMFDNGIFKTWYLSCVKWEKSGDALKHYYNIKYAESTDGIHWDRESYHEPVINFKNSYEYAISTPRVIKRDGMYKMWYSYRGQSIIDTYRIGYAESIDGVTWVRRDEEMWHFDVSSNGWDSEMVCYPYIFVHKNKLHMLYNGNSYGKTGFGLAVLEE